MLLDRSGQGKVYQLISRRRFQQMEVWKKIEKKWYFVTKIDLTYCEKKNVLVTEKNFSKF